MAPTSRAPPPRVNRRSLSRSIPSSFPSKSQFNIVIIIIIVIVVVVVREKRCRHRGKDGKISTRRKSESGSERLVSEINESGARLSGKGKKEVVN